MKKSKIIIIVIISIIIVSGVLIFFRMKQDSFEKSNIEKFYLEDKYYGKSSITQITIDELNKLIENKESFGIFINQPMCTNSYEFNKVLISYTEKYKISFYTMSFSDVKTTSLGKHVKYYPSFAIYNKGEYINHLRADKDEDLKYYKSVKNFNDWLTKYINIK